MSTKSCSGADVTSILNEVDTMLSGTCSQDQPKAGTLLESVMATPEPAAVTQLFSTYMVTPAYRAETSEALLIKLATAKGEPFYLLDENKSLQQVVCGLTEVFLAPYDADSACVDECEGLPSLHLVPECIAKKLFSQALKGICTAHQYLGLVFVSSVGLQFYYKGKSCATGDIPMINSVYRVAADADGHIDARDIKGAVTCDYPVPYLLVSEETFSEGKHGTAIVESLTQANAQLIDTLCRLEYVTLHRAEDYADRVADLLGGFMGSHSHRVKSLLDAQLSGAGSLGGRTVCDDAFVRRQRKNEIDGLVRLMMRETELMDEMGRILEELAYVKKAVEQCPEPLELAVCPTSTSCAAPRVSCQPAEDEISDPILRPLTKITKASLDQKASRIMTDDEVSRVEDMITTPLSDDEDMMASPSSGSDYSR